MREPPYTGGCLCGAVRFEVVEPLVLAGYCHCTRCQRRTGTAASVQALAPPGSLRVLAGAEELREFAPTDGAAKVFCGLCGAHLWSRRQGDRPAHAVRLGAFDEDPGIRPSYRQFVASAAPWEPIPDDGLPRFPEARPVA